VFLVRYWISKIGFRPLEICCSIQLSYGGSQPGIDRKTMPGLLFESIRGKDVICNTCRPRGNAFG